MILCSRLRRRKIPMWVMGVGSSQADRNKGLRLLGPFWGSLRLCFWIKLLRLWIGETKGLFNKHLNKLLKVWQPSQWPIVSKQSWILTWFMFSIKVESKNLESLIKYLCSRTKLLKSKKMKLIKNHKRN